MIMPGTKQQQASAENEDGTVKVTLTIPASLVRRIDELAESESRSRSNAATQLIRRGLDPGAPARSAG